MDDRDSFQRRLAPFVAVVQTLLFLVHGVVALAGLWFFKLRTTAEILALTGTLGALSLTFVPASLLAFRSNAAWIKAFYRITVVWLGFLNYLFFGSVLAWLIDSFQLLPSPWIGAGMLTLSTLTALAALLNAGFIRVHRLNVRLPNTPDPWKGRTIAVVSDIHLGHVRGAGFLARLVRLLNRERPDLLVVPGDLYDGTAVDASEMSEPWRKIAPPFGAFFVTGNHDEFRNPERLLAPLAGAGVRTLANEMVEVDGLQIAGVHDGDHRDPVALHSILRGMHLDRSKPTLLLAHSPIHLRIAEDAGVSLQISGHTHGGQFAPWTWVVDRIYGAFAKGLHASGGLQVLTTVGAGTWGPPLRLGTTPEIVLLRLI